MTMSGTTSTGTGTRSCPARAALLALALGAMAALGVLAAGCGGSSGEGAQGGAGDGETTTTSSGSSGRSRSQALLAFSACMRKNGVPNFPDPQRTGSGTSLPFDPDAPGFENAQRTCRRLLPNGGNSSQQEQTEQLQEALDYAACMRENGVPKFPDPRASGGGIEWGELGARVGVDPESPQFKAAEDACEDLAPGA
jgi:hypothetical protein